MKLKEFQRERLQRAYDRFKRRSAELQEAKDSLDDLCTVIAGPGWTLGSDEDGALTLEKADDGEEE